jgi:hypothetical protein
MLARLFIIVTWKKFNCLGVAGNWRTMGVGLGEKKNAHLVCGIPYLMPTPTRGRAFITFFTVAWSGKANIIDAANESN